MMPGEDGLALTQSLRRRSDVPILMLTARGEPEDRIQGPWKWAWMTICLSRLNQESLLLRIETIIRRITAGTIEEGDRVFAG